MHQHRHSTYLRLVGLVSNRRTMRASVFKLARLKLRRQYRKNLIHTQKLVLTRSSGSLTMDFATKADCQLGSEIVKPGPATSQGQIYATVD